MREEGRNENLRKLASGRRNVKLSRCWHMKKSAQTFNRTKIRNSLFATCHSRHKKGGFIQREICPDTKEERGKLLLCCLTDNLSRYARVDNYGHANRKPKKKCHLAGKISRLWPLSLAQRVLTHKSDSRDSRNYAKAMRHEESDRPASWRLFKNLLWFIIGTCAPQRQNNRRLTSIQSSIYLK